jgi:hypothetical protein
VFKERFTVTTEPVAETGRDRALTRVLAEIHAGLRHGYFEYTLTCEVIGRGRRRLVLHAGKNYQFVIPAEECESVESSSDLRDEGAVNSRS